MKDYLEIKISFLDLLFWTKDKTPESFQRYLNFAQMVEFFIYETSNKNAAILLAAGILSGKIAYHGTTLRQCEYTESDCNTKERDILFVSGKRKGEVKETFKPVGKTLYCVSKNAGFGFTDTLSVNICNVHFNEVVDIIKSQIKKHGLKIEIKF